MMDNKDSPTYRGTYNPDKKRGELLKDNMSTGDYFSDLKSAEKEAKKMNTKDSSRTKMMDEMPDNFMSKLARKASRIGDKLGFTQEDKYKGKTKDEMTVKKRAGGAIKSSASKRADGCAVKGKTRGRMV
jgi:hypothetical protein